MKFIGTLVILFSLVAASHAGDDYAQVTKDGRGAIATVHPLASSAAIEVFEQGGSAVDAAVSAAYALGVVDSHNSGIGGGCFVLIRWADGSIEAIDGREMAPAAATADMYLIKGEAQAELSRTGALAIGIPGCVSALDYIQKKGGKLSSGKVIAPAISLAEEGFPIDKIFAGRIEKNAERLLRFSGRDILFDEKAQPLANGDMLVQKDLAHTYRQIVKQGAKYFYQGRFAEMVDRWMKANKGIVTKEDFENYTLKIREPVVTAMGEYTLVGFPPPSSGGVHVAQIVSILQAFKLADLSVTDRYHVLAEAMKLAFADRAFWLGDPDFVDVPKGLIDSDYISSLQKKIDPQKAVEVDGHGTPLDYSKELFSKHTTHIAAADKSGNWIAITTTLNTNFGSKVLIPGTGVFMNNQMDDFSAQPHAPNAFGLVGAEANAVAAAKRPLSSMSPTLVLKGQKPVLTIGAAGGPTIISQVVQGLVNHLLLDMPLSQALEAPRVHHQWKPGALFVEPTMAEKVKEGLENKGHVLRRLGSFGATQAIALEDGEFTAVSEPRLKQRNQ